MKSGYRLYWSKEAQNNLNSIISYLQSNWSEKEIRKFTGRLEKILELISENPKLFPPSILHPTIHRAIITKHNSLYYRMSKDDIEIITIFDNRQDPDKLRS
jgi:plasmid stabilization system protein ParE